jgi:hypothetical protein
MSAPAVAVARPNDTNVQWQVYVGGVVKVRQLVDGTVQVAGLDDDDWHPI